jgi:putative phosphoesterase
MKLGILSDTHGHTDRTRTACAILIGESVDAVLHCGDVGSEGVLIELATVFDPLGITVYVVQGNVDHYSTDVTGFSADVSIRMLGVYGDITLDDHRIAIVHGDDGRRRDYAATCGTFDYVFTGHTHAACDERIGDTRIINPGAVYRAAEPSVAVLDLATDTLQYFPVTS